MYVILTIVNTMYIYSIECTVYIRLTVFEAIYVLALVYYNG